MTKSTQYLLDKYPRLREIWPEAMVKKLTFLDHRYNLATISHPEADKYRQQLEDALEWASRNRFLSAGQKGRLRGSGRVQFHSAKDELFIGKFLTRLGQVNPATELPSGRVGDWLIDGAPPIYDGAPPIYVEVKSIYDIDDKARIVEAQLGATARTIQSGRILEATVRESGAVSPKAFKDYLKTSLATLPKKLPDKVELPDYVDPSGLTMNMTCSQFPSAGPTVLVFFFEGGGPITSHLQTRERARRGASQLPEPEEGIPGMVVVCRHSDVPDTGLELPGAMFSLPAINLQTGEWTVQPEGISQPEQHTRVSAIAQYFERTEKLEVVHNPLAKNPIDATRLSAPGVKQLAPDEPGRMRWTGDVGSSH